MKIKIKKNILEKYLTIVSRAISYNPPLIVLKGVLFEVTKTHIILITTNGNLSIRESIESDNKNITIIENGLFLVPCKLLLEIVRKQISDEIIIEANNNILLVNSNKSSVTVNLMKYEDFPNINFDLEGVQFAIKNNELISLYNDVGFAASENDHKIILNGINLNIENKILTASATNSYRLATKKINIDSEKEINITLLAKNLKYFSFENNNKNLHFIIDEQKMNLKIKNTIIQSTLIDGEYPKIENFIPTQFNYTLTINTKNILNAIDRAIVISESNSSSVQMEINSNKEIMIQSRKEQVGTAQVELTDFKWEGGPLQITFDSKFLIDALKTFKGNVNILFNGPLKPIIIKSEDKPELTQLILPQKTY